MEGKVSRFMAALARARAAPAENVADTRSWRYVVVEEIVDDVALLRRWRWPVADPLGHLVWKREEEQDSTAIPVNSLREAAVRPERVAATPPGRGHLRGHRRRARQAMAGTHHERRRRP